MKKIICMLMALVMMLSLVACGGADAPATPPNENTTPVNDSTTPADTDAAEPNDVVSNGETVTYEAVAEYENKIHELGFVEFRADIWRPTPESGPVCNPTSLTFTEDTFELDFMYSEYNAETGEYTDFVWTLYGAKGTEPINISAYKAENYSYSDIFNYADAIADYDASFVHQVDYTLYNMKDEMPCDMVINSAFYYPATSNLYNLVTIVGSPEVIALTPSVMAQTEDDITLEINWELNNMVTSTAPMYMFIMWGPNNMNYSYEADMTMADWAASSYNVDGWTVDTENNRCLTPDGLYYIEADILITEIETVDFVIQTKPVEN